MPGKTAAVTLIIAARQARSLEDLAIFGSGSNDGYLPPLLKWNDR